MGVLLFLMYISLLLKMIYGFSWPAKIMASPFNSFREMCFLEERYKQMQKKIKFWNFWELPLYEFWEYAFKYGLIIQGMIYLPF